MLYTGLKLPAEAENSMCKVVQYDKLHNLSKVVYVRFELSNDNKEKVAEIINKSRLTDISYIYDRINSANDAPSC